MTHGHRFVDFIGEYARQMSSTGAVDGDELTRVLRYAHADDGVDVDDMTVSGNEANVPEIHVNVGPVALPIARRLLTRCTGRVSFIGRDYR